MIDPNYVDPVEFAQWEAARQALIDADNDCQREAQQRTDLVRTEPLLDRIAELEVQAYLATECFAAALEAGRRERDALRLIVLEYEPNALRYVA